MSISLAMIAAVGMMGSQFQTPRDLIAWTPPAGQQLEYWARFGSWEQDRFQEWQTTLRLTTLSVSPTDRFVQTKFVYVSQSIMRGDWLSKKATELPVVTQRLDIYGEPLDAENPLPVNRFWLNNGANACGFRYPHNVVAVGESWKTYEPAIGTVSFTYAGKEKVKDAECFRVTFVRQQGKGNGPAICEGTYWIDGKDGKVVKLQIGARPESVQEPSGVKPGYLELELVRAKVL